MLFLRRANSPFIIKKIKQQRCEHRIRKNKQTKSTVHDAKKNEINKLCVNKQRQSMKIKSICRNLWQKQTALVKTALSKQALYTALYTTALKEADNHA